MGETPKDKPLLASRGQVEAWLAAGHISELNDARKNDREAPLPSLAGSDFTKVVMRDANLDGAHLDGARLEEATLTRATLRKASLHGVDACRADLVESVASEAAFDLAKLDEVRALRADLTKATFRRAELENAELQGARLNGARFLEANLRGANLSQATGLEAIALAGADLSGCRLPEGLEFEAVAVVNEAAKNCRALFVTMLVASAYCLLTVGATTPAGLVLDLGTSTLPILNADVPLARFYVAAPVLLCAVYCYFHLYLQRLWAGIASLPAVFVDGRPATRVLYPWLFISVAHHTFHRLAALSPLFWHAVWRWFRTTICILLGAVACPVVLLLMSRACSAYSVTFWTCFVCFGVASCVGLLAMYRGTRALLLVTLPERLAGNPRPLDLSYRWWARPFKGPTAPSVAILVGIGLLVWLGFSLETRPGTVRAYSADLAGRSLAGVDLEKADLRKAILVDADLSGADLRSARLCGADLTRADLSYADLRGGNFTDADLTGTIVTCAKRDEETFRGVDVSDVIDEGCPDALGEPPASSPPSPTASRTFSNKPAGGGAR